MGKEKRTDKFISECKWLWEKNLYHRGKYDNKKVYENTIDAFKASIDADAPFEFDVQLTSDLEVVCFHDDSLKRLFNRERLVNDISYKRLNKLRDDLQVPTLKEVLSLVDGKVGLMIELKNTKRKYNKILVEKVNELLKAYKGKYVIVSFNSFMLSEFRRLNKDAFIGRICSSKIDKFWHKVAATSRVLNLVAKPDFISCHLESISREMLAKYKSKGYKIIGWTLTDKEKEQEYKKDYDNFIVEGDSY